MLLYSFPLRHLAHHWEWCLAFNQISQRAAWFNSFAELLPPVHHCKPTDLLLSSSWPRPRCVRTHCSSCCMELVLLRLRSASWVGVFCGGAPIPLAGLCSPEPLTCGLLRESVSVDACAEAMLFLTAAAWAGCSLTLLILVRGRSRSPPSFWKPYRSASRCFLSSSVVVETAAAWSWATSRLRSLFWISGSVSCGLWFSTWLLSSGPQSSTFSLSNLIKTKRNQSRPLSETIRLKSVESNVIKFNFKYQYL